MPDSEALRDVIQRLISDSLKSPFNKPDYSLVSFEAIADMYKRQIERLGCTNVTVTAGLNNAHDAIDIEVRCAPPSAPIEISFTVETK